MTLNINYELYERRALHSAQLTNSVGLLVCSVLLIGAGFATYLAINRHAPVGIAFICGIITATLIVSFVLTLNDLLVDKLDQAADQKSLSLLMFLVDQLGNRQEFVDEIAALIREQGQLFQFQANALIMATHKYGISVEELARLQQKKQRALGYSH